MGTAAGPKDMSGAEYYALVGHIKRQHGPKGEVRNSLRVSHSLPGSVDSPTRCVSHTILVCVVKCL